MTPERLGLLWGITVFAGACARLFSSFTGFPSVVILLLSGLFIGRSGLGLVEPLDPVSYTHLTLPTSQLV